MLIALSVSLAGYVIIWPGTTVVGVDVGGMTASAAKSAIAERLAWDSRQVLLRGNAKELRVLFGAELGIMPDLDATVKSCMRPLWNAFSRRRIPLGVTVDEKRFSSFLVRVSEYFEIPVIDAKYRTAPGDRVIIVPHQTGKRLDSAALRDALGPPAFAQAVPEVLELRFVDIPPSTRTEDLEKSMPLEIVASYTTYYSASQKDRAHNIELAASSLSEVMIGPGVTFSFNQTVGPRTQDRGYRKAPVIVGESFQDDYGGGVCQVSTTVYVALVKAGFTVTERYCHGLPVSYVPLGLDATVAWDYLDLKVTNPGPAPCLLRTTAGWGTLTVDIFGKKVDGLTIEVESRVLKEYPAPSDAASPGAGSQPGELPPSGSEPRKLRPGYLVETIRRYIRNGVIESVEKLNTSMYPPEKPPR